MKKANLKIIDDNDGKWQVDFEEDGKHCKSFIVDLKKSRIAKQYSAYGLVGDDLDFILRQATFLKEEVALFEQKNKKQGCSKNFGLIEPENNDIKDKFFITYTSLCMIYRRLFTSNASRGLTLNEEDMVNTKYKSIHEDLMDFGNNYIAHSSKSIFEESKVFIVLDTKKNPNIVYHTRKIYFPSTHSLTKTIEHINDLLEKIKIKFKALQSKLKDEYIHNKLDLTENN
jgi:hypothetical protein